MLDRGEPRSPIDALESMVGEQRQELLKRQRPDTIYHKNREIFFPNFVVADAFREFFLDAANFLVRPHTGKEQLEFRGRLAGRIFSEMAYIQVSSQQDPGAVAFSPDRTLRFYSLLHPGAGFVRHPLTGDSLNGIYVPDGIIADKKVIRAVCEYTALSPDNLDDYYRYIRAKYEGFSQARNTFPEFKHARLRFVMPALRERREGEEENSPVLPQELMDRADVKIVRTNFTREDLRRFVDGVLILLT